MANINDYKIISQKSNKYFGLLTNEYPVEKKITVEDKERFGFYFFILEQLTDKKDFSDLIDIITDQDFNTQIFNKNHDDLGVDAININDDEKIIQLFNFKYREKFSSKKSTINEAIISTKFSNVIETQNFDDLKGKIRIKAEEIIDKLNSKDRWKLQLFVVSNENFKVKKKEDLKRLEKTYGLEIFNIGLDEISQLISIRPMPVSAELVIDKDAVMSFSEDSLSSAKSYIIRLPLSEVIRITCDEKNLREEYNLEDTSQLCNVGLNFDVLFDNVRGFVIKSKFNLNILKTLEEEPTRFFIYNNGLTLITKDIKSDSINANKKIKLQLSDIQVINGGQTLRTIHSFNREDNKNIEKNLSDAQVTLRIFKTESDDDLNNKIAEFTNSQNAISNIDLKSLRSEQLNLEQYLYEHNILYIRKSGGIELNDKDYKYRISMEKFGQILFSLTGFPEKTTNQKKNIFDKYYEEIFGASNLKIEEAPEQIKRYFVIRDTYKIINDKISDQKIFYILYLDKMLNENLTILINKFEEKVKEFSTEKELSEARKLIRNDFKLFIDKKFKISVN